MPCYVRLDSQGRGQLEHLKIYKGEVTIAGGPFINRQEMSDGASISGSGELRLDVGYPITETGTVTSWYYYNPGEGTIKQGDVVAVICRIESATGIVTVVGKLDMDKDMEGRGIWEHTTDSASAVAGDWIGFWIASSPSPGGTLPKYSYCNLNDATQTSGSIYVGNIAEPTVSDTISYSSFTQSRRRVMMSGRGAVSGETIVTQSNGVEEPYVQGDGPIMSMAETAEGSLGTAPTFYVHDESGGNNEAYTNMFNLSFGQLDGFQVDAGSSLKVSARLADTSNKVRVGSICIGVWDTTAAGNGASQNLKLLRSNDIENLTPSGITDWTEFFSWPADAHYDNLWAQKADVVHLARQVKWIQLQIDNQSGAAMSVMFFLIYPVEVAVGAASTEFTPNWADTNSEYMMGTEEGATFLVTTGGTSATIAVAQAQTEDFRGMANPHSIWHRAQDGTRTKYVISSVDSGAKTITLTQSITVVAGDWLDTRILTLRVDGYDSNGDKIRESPRLLFYGLHHSKFFKVIDDSQVVELS